MQVRTYDKWLRGRWQTLRRVSFACLPLAALLYLAPLAGAFFGRNLEGLLPFAVIIGAVGGVSLIKSRDYGVWWCEERERIRGASDATDPRPLGIQEGCKSAGDSDRFRPAELDPS